MAKIVILIEDGFRDEEAVYPYYRLQEAGHRVDLAAKKKGEYHGKFGTPLRANKTIDSLKAAQYDGVVIPGGLNAPDKLRMEKKALSFIAALNKSGKLVAAICHGVWLLASADILKGRTVTGYRAVKDDIVHAGATYKDTSVVVDKNFVTSRHPGDLPDFMREILKKLK